jgi:hypothetical protein
MWTHRTANLTTAAGCSDLTDEEWAHVAPVIPPAKPRRQPTNG